MTQTPLLFRHCHSLSDSSLQFCASAALQSVLVAAQHGHLQLRQGSLREREREIVMKHTYMYMHILTRTATYVCVHV